VHAEPFIYRQSLLLGNAVVGVKLLWKKFLWQREDNLPFFLKLLVNRGREAEGSQIHTSWFRREGKGLGSGQEDKPA